MLAKSASGALDLVPIVTVPNLARALADLKERGFLTVGLDSEGETDLAAAPLREPLALVLGAEGKGLRQLTRETCDIRARLDLPGAIKSLNVSNAAAIALYAVGRGAARSAEKRSGGLWPAACIQLPSKTLSGVSRAIGCTDAGRDSCRRDSRMRAPARHPCDATAIAACHRDSHAAAMPPRRPPR